MNNYQNYCGYIPDRNLHSLLCMYYVDENDNRKHLLCDGKPIFPSKAIHLVGYHGTIEATLKQQYAKILVDKADSIASRNFDEEITFYDTTIKVQLQFIEWPKKAVSHEIYGKIYRRYENGICLVNGKKHEFGFDEVEILVQDIQPKN